MSFDAQYHQRNLPTIRPEWLDRLREAAIDPDQPMVDTHHHLWELEGSHYLAEPLIADLCGGHRVQASVFVECKARYRSEGPEALRPLGETQFALEEGLRAEALSGGRLRACAGIVGYADLALGAPVAAVLEAHVDLGRGRFRGIRARAAWHAHPELRGPSDGPPEGLLLSPAFQAGFAQLAPLGLSCDVWVYHTQLEEVCQLADRFPGTAIVLDHMGGPLGIGPYAGQKAAVFAGWRRSLMALARRPNVTIKLGGLAMPRIGFAFDRQPLPPGSDQLAAAWQDYVDVCLEAFGAERCMFESNFPVDKGMCSYTVIVNAYKTMLRGLTPGERQSVLHDVGSRFYRLDAVA